MQKKIFGEEDKKNIAFRKTTENLKAMHYIDLVLED